MYLYIFEDGQSDSINVVTCSVNKGDSIPINQPPRYIPFASHKKVKQVADDMTQKKVVNPLKSPWASPVILIVKKNGETRFCVDYRKLNSVTKMNVYPLHRIDDKLDSLF